MREKKQSTKLTMKLEAVPNPDFSPGSHPATVSIPAFVVPVSDLADARDKSQEFIMSNDLGGGNVGDFPVYNETGKIIAFISYNGRVWTPEDNWEERKEIKIDNNEIDKQSGWSDMPSGDFDEGDSVVFRQGFSSGDSPLRGVIVEVKEGDEYVVRTDDGDYTARGEEIRIDKGGREVGRSRQPGTRERWNRSPVDEGRRRYEGPETDPGYEGGHREKIARHDMSLYNDCVEARRKEGFNDAGAQRMCRRLKPQSCINIKSDNTDLSDKSDRSSINIKGGIEMNEGEEMAREFGVGKKTAGDGGAESALDFADAIMNGNKFIQTGWGKKTREGIAQMLLTGDPEVPAAIMNGKDTIETGWGKKKIDGIKDMMDRSSDKTNKTAGSLGKLSGDASDVLGGIITSNKDKTSYEIMDLAKQDNLIAGEIREMNITNEELIDYIDDVRALYGRAPKTADVESGNWVLRYEDDEGTEREEVLYVVGGRAEAMEEAGNFLNANYVRWEILYLEPRLGDVLSGLKEAGKEQFMRIPNQKNRIDKIINIIEKIENALIDDSDKIKLLKHMREKVDSSSMDVGLMTAVDTMITEALQRLSQKSAALSDPWVVEEGRYEERVNAIKHSNAKRFDDWKEARVYFNEQAAKGKPVYLSGGVETDMPQWIESPAYKKEMSKMKD